MSERKRGPVTEETVRQLEEAGMWRVAEIARKYVKRDPWWKRIRPAPKRVGGEQ